MVEMFLYGLVAHAAGRVKASRLHRAQSNCRKDPITSQQLLPYILLHYFSYFG